MKPQLISEIKRIHEIMGITPQEIISEQKGSLVDAGINWLSTIMKGFDNGLVKGIGNISRETFENRAKQVLQRVEDGLPLSPAERRFYARIVTNTLPDLTRTSFTDGFIPAVRAIGEQIPGLGEINMLRALRNPKATDDEVVDALWKAYGGGTQNPLIPNLTKDDLYAFRKMEMANIKPDDTPLILPRKRPEPDVEVKPDEPTPPPKPDEEPTPPPKPDEEPTPPPDEPTPPPDGDDAVLNSLDQNFINRVRDDIPDLTQQQIDILTRSNKGFRIKLARLWKKISGFFASNETKLNELAQLMKAYPTLNVQQQTEAFERIQTLLVELTRSEKKLFSDIDNFINQQVRPYMPPEGLSGLETAMKFRSGDGWAKAKALADGTAAKEYKEKFPSYLKRKGMLREQLVSVFSPFSWFGKKFKAKYAPDGNWSNAVANKWKKIISGPEFAQFREYFKRGTTMSREQWKAYVELVGLPKALLNIPLEWVKSILLYSATLALYDWFTGFLSDVLDVQGDYLFLSKDKNEKWDRIVGSAPWVDSDNPWTGFLSGAMTFFSTTGQYFVDNVSLGLSIPPLVGKILYGFNELTRGTATRDYILELRDEFLNTINMGMGWFNKVPEEAERRINSINYSNNIAGFSAWAGANLKVPEGFSEIVNRGYDTQGKIYFQIEPGKSGYTEWNTQINTVPKLLSKYPVLNENKSEIVRNKDGSFTEKVRLNSEAPYITQDLVGDYIIDIKNEKAFYVTNNQGVKIQPLEITKKTD